jgi:Geranylgeranyl pyrophosphate synthase
MVDLGSITYAMDRARSYISAAHRDLDQFEDSTAKRALSVTADYMYPRSIAFLPACFQGIPWKRHHAGSKDPPFTQ